MSLPRRLQPYWPLVQASAERHGLNPYVLAGIMDRESLCGFALEPTGPAGTGDGGHGRGLMQVDARYHSAFCAQVVDGKTLWQDPACNIDYGAGILAGELLAFGDMGECAVVCAIAAYNAGRARVREAASHVTAPRTPEAVTLAVDPLTTHKDYVRDVMRRALQFRSDDAPRATPPPVAPKETP